MPKGVMVAARVGNCIECREPFDWQKPGVIPDRCPPHRSSHKLRLARARRQRSYWRDPARSRAQSLAGYHREDPARRRERRRERILANSYGITKEDYEALLVLQRYRCAVCGRPDGDGQLPLAVDHDHETGVVRGLLCGQCNTAIGLFAENRDHMVAAIAYLEARSALAGTHPLFVTAARTDRSLQCPH